MSAPAGSQPVLPLDREAQITVRHMRLIAANMRLSDDYLMARDAHALDSLANALERSISQSRHIRNTSR